MKTRKNKKKAPQILIGVGCVLLVIAGALQAYGLIDDYQAGRRAQLLLEQMPAPAAPAPQKKQEPVVLPDAVLFAPAPPTPSPTSSPTAPPTDQAATPPPDQPTPQETAPPVVRYDLVGVLSIPRLRLQLPVIADCTPGLLKISVCRYQGDAQDKPKRLVVAGHNYNSHFGRIPSLQSGDDLSFTNVNGVTYAYTVTETAVISMDDQRGLARGQWDITLFTCDKDRTKRVLVRCQEVG